MSDVSFHGRASRRGQATANLREVPPRLRTCPKHGSNELWDHGVHGDLEDSVKPNRSASHISFARVSDVTCRGCPAAKPFRNQNVRVPTSPRMAFPGPETALSGVQVAKGDVFGHPWSASRVCKNCIGNGISSLRKNSVSYRPWGRKRTKMYPFRYRGRCKCLISCLLRVLPKLTRAGQNSLRPAAESSS